MDSSALPGSHHGQHAPLAHVVDLRVLLAVFAALLVLTAVTVAVSYFDFGVFNLFVALAVATLKAVLVAVVGVWVVWRERDHLFALMHQPLATSMDDFASLVLLSSLLIVASLALIAAMIGSAL